MNALELSRALEQWKEAPGDDLSNSGCGESRLQRVEESVVDQALVGDQAPVGGLPGADLDARDVKTLVRPGGAD
jgi:hypothetical protein